MQHFMPCLSEQAIARLLVRRHLTNRARDDLVRRQEGDMGFWVGCHSATPNEARMEAALQAMIGFATDLGWSDRRYVLAPQCRVAWLSRRVGETPPALVETTCGVTFGDIALYDRAAVLARLKDGDPTASDLTLAGHLLETHGPEAAAHLNADFALGRLDPRSGALTLWRDHFGVRTLFHHTRGDLTCFSSLVPPLLRLPGGSSAPSAFSLGAQLLLGSPMSDRTAYDGIRAVLPGGFVTFTGDAAPRTCRYWAPQVGSFRPDLGDDERMEAFREILLCAVEARLGRGRGSVLLSGGLDSATLAAAACATNPVRQLLSATTVLPPDYGGPETDERRHVEALAAHFPNLAALYEDGAAVDPLGPEHDPLILTGPREDPFSSMTDALCQRLAHADADVTLMGHGGDDGISGHGTSVMIEALLSLDGRAAREELHRLRAGGVDVSTILRSLIVMPLVPLPLLRWRWKLNHIDWLANKALSHHACQELRLVEYLRDRQRDARLQTACSVSEDEALNLALYQEDGGVSGDPYEARTGIVMRFPLLDKALVAATLGMPTRLKVLGPHKRGLIRRAAEPWLPDGIRLRDDKGHANPAFRWHLAPCAPRLRAAFDRFARDPLWRYLVDRQKIERGLAALEQSEASESLDVLIMNTVMQPYRLGRFLEAWEQRAQMGMTTGSTPMRV